VLDVSTSRRRTAGWTPQRSADRERRTLPHSLLDERTRIEGAIEYLHRETPGSLEDETEEVIGGSDNHSATPQRARSTVRSTTRSRAFGTGALQIDAALSRIGEDLRDVRQCGKPSRRAARARPWASLCIDCQREPSAVTESSTRCPGRPCRLGDGRADAVLHRGALACRRRAGVARPRRSPWRDRRRSVDEAHRLVAARTRR